MILRPAKFFDIHEGRLVVINGATSIITQVLDAYSETAAYKGGDGSIHGLSDTMVKMNLSPQTDTIRYIGPKGEAIASDDSASLVIERRVKIKEELHNIVIEFQDDSVQFKVDGKYYALIEIGELGL